MPRGRSRGRRGTGKKYFRQEHEDAIVKYAKITDLRERTYLYENFIGPVFSEMVDKIVYTYHFTNLSNVDDLKDECKIWLTTILDKYDPSKGSKAFSYFSVITKNWFIHKVKRQQKQVRRETDLGSLSTQAHLDHMSTVNTYIPDRMEREFWELLWKEMESWDPAIMKENERRVYEAVKILLANPDDIEIFNKKAIYLYLREITGLNTKQVVNNLNKMRKRYRSFKDKWDGGQL
jgi:DNA-directed RNA polymerase specialized sigma24 family protein